MTDKTPRTLLRTAPKNIAIGESFSQSNSDKSKILISSDPKATIKAIASTSMDNLKVNKFHQEILNNPIFQGQLPRIKDQVFYLENPRVVKPHDKKRSLNLNRQNSSKSENSSSVQISVKAIQNSYDSFEVFLICLNIFLFIGISITVGLIIMLVVMTKSIE
eukprot:gene7261-9899_t